MLHLHTVYPYTLRRCAVHVLRTLAVLARCPCCSLRSLSVWLALLFTSSGPIASSRSLSVLLAALACPRLCVRLLMPGQRWTFLSAVPVRSRARARPCALPCLPAPVPACSRTCLLPRPCPCSLRSPPVRGLLAPVVRAYIVASPAVLLLAVLLSPPAANFFEIVCGASISIPPSPAGVGGTTLYCCTGRSGCLVIVWRSHGMPWG